MATTYNKAPKNGKITKNNKTRKGNANRKSTYALEKQDLDFRIYAEYIKQGGIQGPKLLKDIVNEFRPYASEAANVKYAWRLRNSPEIKKKFNDKFDKRRKSAVMSVEERRLYLSDIIMQEIEEGSTLGERLKCLIELNRMDGIGTGNASVVVNNNTISLEEERKLTEKKLNQLLGIEVQEAEYVETEVKDEIEEQGNE